MERREFMKGAVAAAGLATAATAWTQAGNQGKLSRMAIMMFGLNNIVKNNFPPSPERTLDIMEFGELCADRYHVHQIELQSNYFPSTEMSWLADFKARLAKTKTKVVQVNLEFGMDFGDAAQATVASPAGRLQMIDLHRVWFDKLAFLECPRVLVNQGQPTPGNKEQTIENYKALVGLAKAKNIKVASENRDNAPPSGRGFGGAKGGPGGLPGISAAALQRAMRVDPDAPPPGKRYPLLIEILQAAGAYTCVDCLNFPDEPTELAGMRAMIPYSSGLMHAGGQYDTANAIKLTRELGYQGLYSIKAGFFEKDPLEAAQKVIDGVLANM